MKIMPKSGSHPFADLIGLEFTEVDDGSSCCCIEICDDFMNPHQVVHGGVIYSLVDTGMGGALYTLLEPDESCATLEIKINYFKSVSSGTLDCFTRIVNKRTRIAVLESDVTLDGELIAMAMGTYSIFPAKPPR